MGAWGNGIEQSDTVLDIAGAFVAALRTTQDPKAASAKVRQEFAYRFADDDTDQRAHARIGLALAQWRHGVLETTLLQEVREDLDAGRGIDSYNEAAAREKAVRAFVAKLAVPNPRPRALPKPPPVSKRPRKPRLAAFEAGDCLALQLASGKFRAALVLVRDRDGNGDEFNVIARLDWLGTEAPSRTLFDAPRVLNTAMYPGGPYRGAAHAAVIDRIAVDAARFGIEKMPGHWAWQIVRAGRSPRPMTWLAWDDLAGGALANLASA
jgi:hypothetical protein